ncbi:hypothetical protein ABVT39_027926 [Epinephelus coioides]
MILTTTTTEVMFESIQNCSLSIGNDISGNPLTGLIPGAVYQIFLECFNCCKTATTKPGQVMHLAVSETVITTSSIFVTWTKPEGNSSSYKVRWTDGTTNRSAGVNETNMNITGLTAGVQYGISVVAVADDGWTEGEESNVSQYTKPEVVRNLTVTQTTTSSISVMWIEPEGNRSFYRVQWTDGNVTDSDNVTETHKNITNLTAGVQYEISVTAVAGNGSTAGRSKAVSKYTKPEVVRNLSVPQITTSSVFVTWAEPVGASSFYRVQWTGGNLNQSDTVNETYINITELTAGEQYTFTVTTVAGDGKTFGKAKTVSLYTKPEVVRNLSVPEITTSSVFVTWAEPVGESSFYRVQWTGGNLNQSDTVNETYINITELTAGEQYTFTVTTVAGDGKTFGKAKTVSLYTKPEVVRNLSVPEITTSSVFVTWAEPVGESSFYRVQWTGGNLNQSDTVNETYINITELTAGEQYTFTVTTVAGDGKTFGKAKTVSLYTKPEVVRNLTVTQITTSSVFVTWAEPVGESSFYRVQWTGGNLNQSDTVNETYINITELTAGEQYTFTVTTVAGDGKTFGKAKTVSLYTKPEVVRNLTVTQITTSSVFVTWAEPVGESSFYRVQWTGGNLNQSDTVNETYINITELTAGEQYTFTVTTVAGDGKTFGKAKTVSLYTKPEVVRNLSVPEITTSSVFVTWAEPVGESSFYRVQWTGGNLNQSDTVNETYINITELTAGEQYTFTVTTVAGDGKTFGKAKTVSLYTKPEVVRNLTVTQITTSSVFVTWAEPVGESSFYRVQWTGGNLNQSDTVNETYINITELTAGEQYTFTVTTVAGDGKTFGKAKTVSLYTKPEVVRNLTVTQITTSSVFVTWAEPVGESSFYRVQWTGGNLNQSDTVNETYINITELTAGEQYTFTVTTVAGDGKTFGKAKTVSLYTKPEVVRNLTVTQITTSSVFLTWAEPVGESSFYRVQWTGGNLNQSDTVNETYINITELTAGEQYTFTVTTVAGDGKTFGKAKTVSLYTKPEVVRNLTVTQITTSSVFVTWAEPVGESSFYRVQWTGGNLNQSDTVNETYINITELTAGEQYTFTVTTVAGDGKTFGKAKTVSLYTKPEVVRNLTVTQTTTSSISVMWTEPEGNRSFYRVQWTDGNVPDSDNVTETHKNITNLTAGVQYEISVTAVAGDGSTAGRSKAVSKYTRPGKIVRLDYSTNTSSISLNWTSPPGEVFMYKVEWHNGGATMSRFTHNTSAVLSDLLAGTRYTITVIAIAGDNHTDGEGYTSTIVTKPDKVRNLSITGVTKSSVSLDWIQPEGNATSYIVQWTAGGDTPNNTTNTSFTISSLEPGYQYNITVAAVAVNPSNIGEGTLKTTFTEPEKPENINITARGTNYLSINWTLPEGRVDHYVVNISNEGLAYLYSNKTSVNTAHLTGLHPGRIYFITVTSVAGNFMEVSDQASFATEPTPPGPIIISQRTNSSLHLRWETPALMEGAPDTSYIITFQPEGGAIQHKSSIVNNTELSSLSSGTSYNITVQTVGPQSLRSSLVHNSTFTLPNPVLNLEASPQSNTSIVVKWSDPQGVQPYYKYLVQTYSTAGTLFNETVSNNSTDVPNLEPGTRYDVSVTTIAATGSESTVEQTFNYTMPNAVTELTVEDGNTTAIRLTWLRQSDHKPSYSYLVIVFQDTSVFKNYSTKHETYTFVDLTPGELYTFKVFTVVEGVRSTVESISTHTRPYPVTMLRQTEITTSEVTLEWEQPESKPDYSYVVQTTNGSFPVSETVFNRTATITKLLSGSNYSFTVTTQTADGTQADPRTVSYFTRPYSVGWLKAETLNTTAVRLVWTKPLQYKSDYTYRLETSGCGSKNKTFAGVDAEISKLTPGTNCTFCVSVRAADDTEGQARCTSQYTKPEAVQPSISSQGSNSSILVSWAKPFGNVEHYKVYLNNSFTSPEEEKLNSTITSFLFDSLLAGRLYTAVVFTNSGPFNASSEFVTNATFPNPPGPIDILQKTTSSIDIRWEEAPLMSGASFHYQLTILSLQGGEYIRTNNTSHTFTPLLSGTSYNISVATVGVMGFESEKVQIHMVTTRPFNVKLLTASPAEESITVMWAVPDQYKESYRYNLTWQSSDGPIDNKLVPKSPSVIERLVPGTRYNISVTTETSDGTKGAPRWISNCTNASQVTDLQCKGTNTTNAKVILSWSKPKGQHSGFQVTVNNDEIIKSTSTCCNYTVPNLRHHTKYTLTVETQSCGPPSTPVSLSCQTGITNPPIPENSLSLVARSSTAHDRFTLQINSSLLNNISGPITHVGVLVTKKQPDATSNLTKYLGKTYRQWKAGDTPVYLATVRENELQTRSGESDLIIEVGDETRWEGYTNGVLDANGKYQYAIVLFTALNLQDKLVNYQESLVSITPMSPVFPLPANPVVVIGIAVGVTLAIFFILFIILIGFIIYWKRLSKTETSDIQIHSMRSVPVRVEDYEAYYKKQRADSNCGFAEEFEDLKLVGTAQSKTHALTLENKPKNRYNNVLPYDSSRVKLSIIHGSPYDDYINANYMPGYNSRKEFIAAQGPLPTTVNEFWRMIWEKNVQTLVMLTRCNEQGRVKCEQYWAPGIKHFDNITVTTTSEIPLEDWTIRDFDIKNVKTAETRSVRHFHFTAWPDHGVPQTTELLISFRHMVREHMEQYSRHSPTVVHCSAGVGRTGTFIAIDRLIFQIEREYYVDVYGIVHDLRMHRPLMVQTEDQYVFLNQCAMDIIRSRTGTNVDLIYQNTAALSIYENVEPKKGYPKNGFKNSKV